MSKYVTQVTGAASLPSGPGSVSEVEIIATVAWTITKAALTRGSSLFTLVVQLSRSFPFEVLVPYFPDGASPAVDGVDFTLSKVGGEEVVRFAPGQTIAAIRVNPLLITPPTAITYLDIQLGFIQLEVEGVVGIVVPNGNASSVRLTFADAIVAPPGFITWSFEAATASFNEDESPALTRIRVLFDEPLTQPCDMRFYTTNGTAIAPGDYTAINATGTLAAGTTQFSIPLVLIDDNDSEPAETFTVHGEVISGNLFDGAFTSCTVTINASDSPTVTPAAYWDVDPTTGIIINEGASAYAFDVVLDTPAPINISVPVQVIPGAGSDPNRLNFVFPGGTFGQVRFLAQQQRATVQLSVPLLSGAQPNMTFDLKLGAGTGFEVGAPDTLSIIVNDNGVVVLPIVQWQVVTATPITEGGSGTFVSLVVVNPTEADLTQPFSVNFSFSGTAQYGNDYRIYSGLTEVATGITFAPGQTVKVITIAPTNDLDAESLENYTITLIAPVGCAIGTPDALSGEIVDNDVPASGSTLRPQFYFPSEVLGRGPNAEAGNRVNLVVELGLTTTFAQDVFVTVDTYSPNAVESADGGLSGDYWFPNGKVCRVPAGSRWGVLEFAALPDGVNGSQKRVMVFMASTSHGQVGTYEQQDVCTMVLLGATDNRGLIPNDWISTPSTALDDYRVYADRIEDLVHGITIPLPFDRNLSTTVAEYGDICTQHGGNGSANDLFNGPAIAAHLAQKVWLDRNGGSFGTREVWVQGLPGEQQIHFIRPAVRYLDEGNPVYISIYEPMANGPHPLYFHGPGGSEKATSQRPGTVLWGRALPNPDGVDSPSCTRDLWLIARSHTHIISELRFNTTQTQTSTPVSGETWRRQAFVDNVHFVGFGIDVDITSGNNYQRRVISERPLPWGQRQKLNHGVIYFDSWVWTRNNVETIFQNFDQHLRLQGPASYVITRCTGARSQEHFAYVSMTGPIFAVAYNTQPVGQGRTMVQNVSRPQWWTPQPNNIQDGHSGGSSHGLCAIVENYVHGDHRWGQAADFNIYGHIGYVFFSGNIHRGDQNVSGVSAPYNRRILSVLADGAQDGLIVFDSYAADIAQPFLPGFPYGSAQPWYSTRYVCVEDEDVDFSGVGTWLADGMLFGGCYSIDIKAPIRYDGSITLGGRPLFAFNDAISPRYTLGAVLVDPLQRPVTGGIGSVYGPQVLLPNRGGFNNAPIGGVRFIGGFAVCLAGGCGSTTFARHRLFSGGLGTATVNFSNLTVTQRNNYDGRDPS